MTWVAWRQQRLSILASLALVAVAAAVMLIVRHDAVTYLSEHGMTGCWASADGCPFADREAVARRYGRYLAIYPLVLLALPPLLGMFIGAPMFAREVERGTHVFGLTQSVSRTRWWVTKAAFGGVPVVAMAGLGLLNSWALDPLRPVMNIRLSTPVFESEAVVLGGYTLLAVALGVTAGLWARNTPVAMAVTLSLHLAIMVTLVNVARDAYLEPVYAAVAVHPAGGSPSSLPTDGNQVRMAYLDERGGEVAFSLRDCDHPRGVEAPRDLFQSCMRRLGITHVASWYHPASRFWSFQLIETGVCAALGTVLLALAAWGTRRRLY